MENVGESDTEAIETFLSRKFFSEKALDGGGCSRKSCRRGWRGGIDPQTMFAPGPRKAIGGPADNIVRSIHLLVGHDHIWHTNY